MFKLIYEEYARLLILSNRNPMPLTTALFGLSVLQLLNLISVLSILNPAFIIGLKGNQLPLLLAGCSLCLFLMNFITCYQPLRESMAQSKQLVKGEFSWVFWVYMIGTFVSSYFALLNLYS